MSHQEETPRADPRHAGKTLSPGGTLEYTQKSWKKFLGRGKSRHLAAVPMTRIRKKWEKTRQDAQSDWFPNWFQKWTAALKVPKYHLSTWALGSVRQVDLPQTSLTLNV